MTKIHTTLTIDPDLFSEARNANMNISGQFEEFLRLKLNQLKNNSAGINLLIKKKEFEKAEKERLKWEILVKMLKDEIEIGEKLVEKRENERLINEKKSIELQKRCVCCSELILPESRFDKAFFLDDKDFFVHVRCYMDWIKSRMDLKKGISKSDMLEWFKEKSVVMV